MDKTPPQLADRYSIPRGAAASQGIDPSRIATMVDQFYDAVQRDALLAPIFAAKVDGDWDPHLDKMRRFWRTVLLAEGAYNGNPMEVHRQLEGLTPAHFQRWIHLFSATVADVFAPDAAAVVMGKAQRMARALSKATLEARCA